jgi:transcriptional regulator with XRE-family HTH domain
MISNKLKSARLAKELTQSEVAKKLYVTRQTVSRWEQGKTLPNILCNSKLSDLYDISLDELVVNTALENKEAKSMKNVNPFALFGAILFNVFYFSLIVIFFGGFLLLSLFISLAMLFSPLILAIFCFNRFVQEFNVIQLVMTVIFVVIGLLSIPLLKKVSVFLFKFFKRYLKFNHKAIFY